MHEQLYGQEEMPSGCKYRLSSNEDSDFLVMFTVCIMWFFERMAENVQVEEVEELRISR